GELPSLGYQGVIRGDIVSNHEGDLPEPEALGAYEAGGAVTVQELLKVVRIVGDLAPIETAKALSVLPEVCLDFKRNLDLGTALRFAMALVQAPYLETWQNMGVDFRRSL